MIPLLSIYGVIGHTKPKTVELGTSQKLERKSNFWGVFIIVSLSNIVDEEI